MVRTHGAGSIPACAGEPKHIISGVPRYRVYPRVCGGTLLCRPLSRFLARSIPACAGEPWQEKSGDLTDAVYPRVCGGTQRVAYLQLLSQGLSPRVRGNRARAVAMNRVARSIPACAGEPGASCGR